MRGERRGAKPVISTRKFLAAEATLSVVHRWNMMNGFLPIARPRSYFLFLGLLLENYYENLFGFFIKSKRFVRSNIFLNTMKHELILSYSH